MSAGRGLGGVVPPGGEAPPAGLNAPHPRKLQGGRRRIGDDPRQHLPRHTGRDAYLYLDTGWSVLGLINACHGGLVRNRFGAHPVAVNGYRKLKDAGALCPHP